MPGHTEIDKTVSDLLAEARQVIDGEMDRHTAEYRVCDLLQKSLVELQIVVSDLLTIVAMLNAAALATPSASKE